MVIFMTTIFYGKIVDEIRYKSYVYLICDDKGIYSLIKHNSFATNVIIRCSDLSLIREVLYNEIKNH